MADMSVFAYSLPCTARALHHFPQKVRAGLFVRFDHEGGYAVAEFAPLAGIHKVNIDDALEAAKRFTPAEIARGLSVAQTVDVDDLAEYFASFPDLQAYVLSMAYFHRTMLCREAKAPSLTLAALIDVDDIPSSIALAQTYAAQGFSHIKVKVGKGSVADDIQKINTIAAIVGKGVKLRIDANRGYTCKEASMFLQGLRHVELEYFEEPTYQLDQLQELLHVHDVKLAIDESLTGR